MNTEASQWPQPPKHPLRPVSVYRPRTEREELDQGIRDFDAGRVMSWEEFKLAVLDIDPEAEGT